MLKNCYNRLTAYFVHCAVLVALTIIVDFVSFAPASFNSAFTSISISGFYPISISYIASFLTLTALFTALMAIPAAGSFIAWLTWFTLTVPCRLYYFTMKSWPTDQDLLNLFSVKIKTSVDTILGLLTPYTVFQAVLPSIVILIIFYLIFRRFSFNNLEISIKKKELYIL